MMRWKPIAWIVVSLLCFVAAIYFWQWGERRNEQRSSSPDSSAQEGPTASGSAITGSLLSASTPANSSGGTAFTDDRFPNRLRNTPASLSELLRSDTGLVLENALFDSSRGTTLPIPAHLRAQGDPGTYIVQARGAITEAFREAIRSAGGTIVSYVPNNAYLVRGASGVASVLASSPLTQAVTPFEPYFKIKGALLDVAVKQELLTEGTVLSVVSFPDAGPQTAEELTQMGGVVLGEDRSPFGTVYRVQVPEDSLSSIAALSGVQMVDRTYVRASANDLARPRLGVAESSVIESNYLDLTGSGVTIQVVDSGVDASQPDLTGRVFADPLLDPGGVSLVDPDGHGTHVAGIIAGDGSQSATVTSTNVGGSVMPAVTGQFRGMAPKANIVSIAAVGGDVTNEVTSQVLVASAVENGALISNNSWRFLGDTSYDIMAANYDAAVRDAQPEITGSQPVLFVFAAGNEGDGNEDGTGGLSDTIGSPSTAKNVITVGAIEQLRDLTNSVVTTNLVDGELVLVTNDPPFEYQTDTDYQVAYSSSRGNVGVGLEGEFGRFKPDVVAPGEFVISTRSGQWNEEAYYNPTNYQETTFYERRIRPGLIYVAQTPELFTNTVGLTISVSTPEGAPAPLPDLPIYVRTDRAPQVGDTPLGTNTVTLPPDAPLSPLPGRFWYGVGNPTNYPIFVNVTRVIATTNDDSINVQAQQELNADLAPDYRYESGTSMAAPAISGTLALMQEYYVKLYGTNPSPALLKALLVNASRSTWNQYDFQVNNVVNFQGWGLPNLPNILPGISNSSPTTASAVQFFEQSVDNALETGQSHTRTVAVDPGSADQSLRFTLVWTDPPGNPLVGTKLVNDLDLIVTNLDTGDVYYGNDIPAQSDYTDAWDTNAVPNVDLVNNVENVFLPGLSGTNFSVTVYAHRVNVNAVTAHPDETVQDYALVMSSSDVDGGAFEAALTVVDGGPAVSAGPEVNYLTPSVAEDTIQGALVENQRVGENAPLLGSTNGINNSVNSGISNQWRFYVLTNTMSFTNATFVTFLPGTLSVPRMGVYQDDEDNATRPEADIDLYVTQDPTIVDLNPTAINGAEKSLGRGGTEAIVLTNANTGAYYVGVKSEDHEAANFSFFGAFSLLPISSEDENGVTLQGIPVPNPIPDGSPQSPKAALILGVASRPINVRRVVVTNSVSHQNFGDLIGNLSHGTDFAVLNNKSFPLGDPTITNYTYYYDDLEEGDIVGSQTTDGPGSLRNFSGKQGVGVWLMSMVDDSFTQTGRVNNFIIRLDKAAETNVPVTRVIQPYAWTYDVVDVPPEATNFTICVSIIGSSPLPVELYIKRGDFPSETGYDVRVPINPPGRCASISTSDLPPLQAGKYYFGIYNPNDTAQTVEFTVFLELGLDARDQQAFSDLSPTLSTDDAVSYAYKMVNDDRRISGLEVGLVVEHPRVSDLAITLVSPQGKRVLLVENRGGTSTNGLGGGSIVTNYFPVAVAGDATANTNVLNVGANRGTLLMDYDFFDIPDQMRVYYDGAVIYDSGLVSGTNAFALDFGPGVDDFLEVTMNEGDNSNTNTAWTYTPTVIAKTLSYLVLTEDQDKTTTPIKFGVPPFQSTAGTGLILFDGFEGITPGVYSAGNNFGAWTVITNEVAVTNDPPGANSGSQYLGLGRGAVSRVLPTIAGHSYALTFAYRGEETSALTNGSFEVPSGIPVYQTFNVGTNLPGWVINSGSVDVLGPYFQAAKGSQSLDLNGNNPAILYQDFATTPGQTYQVRFAYAGNPEAAPTIKTAAVRWSGLSLTNLSFDVTGHSVGNMGWVYAECPATAIGTTSRLEFEATVAGRNGMTLDDVEVFGLLPSASVLVDHQLRIIDHSETWQTNTIVFTASQDDALLEFAGLEPNMLIDTITLEELPADVYYLPEESMQKLVGDNSKGLWTLELWDNRVGATSGPPRVVTWELRFTYETVRQTPIEIQPGIAITNDIPAGQMLYLVVDVPYWAQLAANSLLFSIPDPVNVYFNQTNPPAFGGTNAGDFLMLANSTQGGFTLETGGTPPLIPDDRYYIGIENPGTNTVTIGYQVNFDLVDLTNAISYTKTNNGVAPIQDYYRFVATDPVARLQFEILQPTTDITLLVRKNLPLPGFGLFDYLSAEPGTNEEYIVVLDTSTPVPASSGEWFLTAYNLSGQAGSYQIKATQFAVTGQPIVITGQQIQAGSFCFDWNSLPGAKYVVQAKVALADPDWDDISGTIEATANTTSFCVPLPTPYQFFRVKDGVAVDETSTAQIRILSITSEPGARTLRWLAPPTFQFDVEYSDVFPPVWTLVPGGPITSADGSFVFVDDGTQTGGLPPIRYYRLVLLP